TSNFCLFTGHVTRKEQEIKNIELEYLKVADYEALKEATLEAYGGVLNSYWKKHHIEQLTSIFPEGQVVIKIDGEIAGCALSLIVDYDSIEDNHTYADIVKGDTFKTHDRSEEHTSELQSRENLVC